MHACYKKQLLVDSEKTSYTAFHVWLFSFCLNTFTECMHGSARKNMDISGHSHKKKSGRSARKNKKIKKYLFLGSHFFQKMGRSGHQKLNY